MGKSVQLGVLLVGLGLGSGCSSEEDGDAAAGTAGGAAAVGAAGTAGLAPTAGTVAPGAGAGGAMLGSGGSASPATGGAAAPVAGAAAAPATGGTDAPAAGDMNAGAGGMDAEAGGGGDAAGGEGSGVSVPMGTCLQGSGDFSQDGPYDVRTKDVTIDPRGDFTLYIPEPLEDDCPHPMVAWGNGTTVPGGTAYRHFNNRMATWGIVVIVSHDDGTADSGPRIGDGSFHEAGIDYLLAENEDPSSELFGKLSGRAGVAGHSQGGAGGDRASMHPNVEANGNVQGSFGRAPSDVAFLCLTGTDDIATEGCLTAVSSTSAPAMYASYDGMSHTATLSSRSAGSQQYARLLSGWFRCFLADDTAACDMFRGGESCPLCQESGWDSIFSANY